MSAGRKYVPRRAGKRWLEGAPEYVLDCFRHRKQDGNDGGFDVLFCGSLLGTFTDRPQNFANTYIMGLDLDADGRYCSFELNAYDAANFRYRSSHYRVKWGDLPKQVRKSVEEWATPEESVCA